jgi:hypothetical protein
MIIKNTTPTKCEVACDDCGKLFEKYISQCGELQFCSRECIKRAKLQGGKIHEKSVRTCRERYGVDNVFSSNQTKEKIKSVLLEKYGVDNPRKSDLISDKARKTCMSRYGVDNPAKSDIIREKERETYSRKTPDEMFAILSKRVTTNLQKYGVEYPMQIEDIKSKFDWASAYKKSCETRSKNRTGTYQSKIEILVGNFLCDIFGEQNVVSQVPVNERWIFDFYVISEETYIQVDGTYWHGLNRPIDEIKKCKSSKDNRILETYNKDRLQDEWADKNGICLVRITDEEINTWLKKSDPKEMIRNRISLKKTFKTLPQL